MGDGIGVAAGPSEYLSSPFAFSLINDTISFSNHTVHILIRSSFFL